MSFREKMPKSPKSHLRRRRSSWSGSWLNHPVVIEVQSPRSVIPDPTLSLSDSLLLKILQKLPLCQSNDVSLVCKRWLTLQGRRVRTLKVYDWDFLLSGRLVSRFPKLTDVDLAYACTQSQPNSSGILLCHKSLSFHVSPDSSSLNLDLLHSEMVDRGLRVLGCDLLKLVVVNATELGLLALAQHSPHLQHLQLHMCNDNLLRGIAACQNLRALTLVATMDALYTSSVSDIGLTILAQGCKRLAMLELCGCQGSFDGIKAIGQCCELLQQLSISHHRMDHGWIAALSFFPKLKTLHISSCTTIDPTPGPSNLLASSCPALQNLQLQRCCLNDKDGMRALFKLCDGATKLHIQDCWGLDDASFTLAKAFRRVRYLSLEGCSLLTTSGLESVILQWEELESMRVVSCRNIRDSEISPALSSLFSLLKELVWRPDTRSHLSSSLEGAGIGKRGSKFFKKR